MYITQCFYGSANGYETLEEAEKHIADMIDPGEEYIIAEVVKAFKADPAPYKSVDLLELNAMKKKAIEGKIEE